MLLLFLIIQRSGVLTALAWLVPQFRLFISEKKISSRKHPNKSHCPRGDDFALLPTHYFYIHLLLNDFRIRLWVASSLPFQILLGQCVRCGHPPQQILVLFVSRRHSSTRLQQWSCNVMRVVGRSGPASVCFVFRTSCWEGRFGFNVSLTSVS